MNHISKFYKRIIQAVPTLFLAVVLLAMAVGVTTVTAASQEPQLMFVQSAEDLKVDQAASTFRLVMVNQQTLYFSDRPVRIAGHIKMADYLKE